MSEANSAYAKTSFCKILEGKEGLKTDPYDI